MKFSLRQQTQIPVHQPTLVDPEPLIYNENQLFPIQSAVTVRCRVWPPMFRTRTDQVWVSTGPLWKTWRLASARSNPPPTTDFPAGQEALV